MKLCYDIECDGLDPTELFCIVAQNLDTQLIYKFTKDENDGLPSIRDGVRLLENAALLVGHNIIGFDNRVVDKLHGTNLNDKRCHDTFVMSQTLRYKRSHKHGLAGWGEHLGNSKWQFDDWEKYSPEMLKYCVQDVKVNVDIYNALLAEYSAIYAKNPKIKQGLKVEHDCAVFNAKVRELGWNFDLEQAEATLEIMNTRLEVIESIMEPKIGTHIVYIDKEPKTPKYKKNGEYNSHTVNWLTEYFGHEVKSTDTHLMAPGTEFQRTKEEQIKMGSLDLVKDWLLTQGWVPDEYKKKKIGWEWVTMGPELTTTSLKKLGDIGELVSEWTTLRSRAAVVRGWLDKQREGRLHGNMWTIGTPTFRCRHEVIVNLPAVDADWGKEIRQLLIADPGYVVVGADSSGNQLRGLCHYVNNDEFTNEVIFGDQHQRNADALNCSRPIAKSYLYAYLFGAGDAKLGQVLTGKSNASKGKKSREDFAKGIKGLQELKDKLSKIWKNTKFGQGEGWIPGLDGRPVFVNSDHQTLNYLLQSAEGITCKASLSWAMNKLKEEGLEVSPRIFYHDEFAFQCKPEDADRVGAILTESFAEGPKAFGVECMDGGAHMIGNSYAAIH